MSAFDTFKSPFRSKRQNDIPQDDYIGDMPTNEYDRPRERQQANSSKVYTYSTSTTLHLVVNSPKKYSEAAKIAEMYRNQKTVILMFNNTDRDEANHLIDFFGGVTYITGGVFKRIGETTYVLAPLNVDISGELIDEISNISGEDIFDDLG